MWKPKFIDTDKSLFVAVADALESDICKSALKPGEKLPTHRELAEMIGINVSTATRAYKEAERRGLIVGTTGRGTYVSTDYHTDPNILGIEENTSSLIDLGPVYPLYNNEPEIFELIQNLNRKKNLNQYMKYSDPQGLPEHREAGSEWLKRYGINASAADIVICAGTQHALTCCFTSLFHSGDRIGVDYLTYSGLKALAKGLNIKLIPIHFDKKGMDPENLESACHREQLKGIYIMPSVHNPTTLQMTSKRKQEIAEIAIRNNLIVIEDDTYAFTLESPSISLYSMIPSNCVHISGLSKAFFAGLRVSFVTAPKHLGRQISKAILNTIWMVPTLNAALVAECINEGYAEKIIRSKLIEARERFDIAKRQLSGFTLHGFPNTYYIWLELPENWTAHEFEMYSRKAGINVFGAEKFIVGSTLPPSAIRISLSGVNSREILSDGLKKIASLLHDDPLELSPIL
jgi:DNA-binding transcriptional MocR family regulator